MAVGALKIKHTPDCWACTGTYEATCLIDYLESMAVGVDLEVRKGLNLPVEAERFLRDTFDWCICPYHVNEHKDRREDHE